MNYSVHHRGRSANFAAADRITLELSLTEVYAVN